MHNECNIDLKGCFINLNKTFVLFDGAWNVVKKKKYGNDTSGNVAIGEHNGSLMSIFLIGAQISSIVVTTHVCSN